jgi:hypothetical protein
VLLINWGGRVINVFVDRVIRDIMIVLLGRFIQSGGDKRWRGNDWVDNGDSN